MRERGFTLIEMLVVLAIMAVLVSAARPVLQLTHQRSQEFALRDSLRRIRTAIDAYKRATDTGQIARSADASGYPPDLLALVEGVPDIKSPVGAKLFFLRRLPRDPFADPNLPPERTWGLRASDSPPTHPKPGKDVFDIYSQVEVRGLDGTWIRDW